MPPARATAVIVCLAQLTKGVGVADDEIVVDNVGVQELRIGLDWDTEITTAVPLVDIKTNLAERVASSDEVGADLRVKSCVSIWTRM